MESAPMFAFVDDEPDLELDDVFAAQVARGEFASVEEALADLEASLEQADADIDAGLGIDADVVFARLHERYANWPRAAE